ncbi:MAG TPA: hypothetical protein PLQ35_17105 [bacterium]|nr:hypothetical protein [bacterium]HQL63997.1 hypothetical protein [bacterium]
MNDFDDNPLFQFIWDKQMEATDNLINDYRNLQPRDLLANCDRMIQCIAGFDTVFLLSPAQSVDLSHSLDDDWLAGFNRTLEMLCVAGTEHNVDLAQFRELATSIYSFWKGILSVSEAEDALKRLYEPSISALHNLKRALIVQCRKTGDAVSHDRLWKSVLRRTTLVLGVFVVVETVIGYLVWRYGEGPNLFQKLTIAWPWMGLGFALSAAAYPFFMSRERMRLIRRLKRESD